MTSLLVKNLKLNFPTLRGNSQFCLKFSKLSVQDEAYIWFHQFNITRLNCLELCNETFDAERIYSTFLPPLLPRSSNWHTSHSFPFYPQNNLVKLMGVGNWPWSFQMNILADTLHFWCRYFSTPIGCCVQSWINNLILKKLNLSEDRVIMFLQEIL